MTPFTDLWVILAIIYLIECIIWIPHQSICFFTWLGLYGGTALPGRLIGNARGGGFFSSLFPFDQAFQVSLPKFSIGPEGLYTHSELSFVNGQKSLGPAAFISFNEIQTIQADGSQITINGKEILSFPTSTHARQFLEDLHLVKKAPQKKRSILIKKNLENTLNVDLCRQALNASRRDSRPLALLCTTLFFYFFLILPVAVTLQFYVRGWPLLLLGYFLLLFPTVYVFFQSHKSRYPLDKTTRIFKSSLMFVAPTMAMRARMEATLHDLANFHPVAVGRLFLNQKQLAMFISEILRDTIHPGSPLHYPEPSDAIGGEANFRLQVGCAIWRSLTPEEKTKMCLIAEQEEDCLSFCPRCHTQFVREHANCRSCGGLKAIPFESEPTGSFDDLFSSFNKK